MVSLPVRQLVEAAAFHNQSSLCSIDASSFIQSNFSNHTDHSDTSSSYSGTEISFCNFNCLIACASLTMSVPSLYRRNLLSCGPTVIQHGYSPDFWSGMRIATSHHSTSGTLLFKIYLKLAGMYQVGTSQGQIKPDRLAGAVADVMENKRTCMNKGSPEAIIRIRANWFMLNGMKVVKKRITLQQELTIIRIYLHFLVAMKSSKIFSYFCSLQPWILLCSFNAPNKEWVCSF